MIFWKDIITKIDMAIEIDLKEVKERALLQVGAEDENAFKEWFDTNYFDMIENPDDYFAVGVADHFYEHYNKRG